MRPRGVLLHDGEWHCVALTRVKSTGVLNLYLDGAMVDTATGNTASLTAPPKISIGARQEGTSHANGRQYFTGDMRLISIYESALLIDQIGQVCGPL